MKFVLRFALEKPEQLTVLATATTTTTLIKLCAETMTWNEAEVNLEAGFIETERSGGVSKDKKSYDRRRQEYGQKLAGLRTFGEQEKTDKAINEHMRRNRMQGQEKVDFLEMKRQRSQLTNLLTNPKNNLKNNLKTAEKRVTDAKEYMDKVALVNPSKLDNAEVGVFVLYYVVSRRLLTDARFVCRLRTR